MRYQELKEKKYKHEHGEEYTIEELAREIKKWMKSAGHSKASLHELWSDFPLRRHIETSNKWARVLRKGEQLQLWELEQGRQKGSKIINLSVKGKKSKDK